MIFGDRSLYDLSIDDFRDLIENRIPEGPNLDYKQTAYSGRADDIREMLRDIVSIANANGGYLIMGIKEDGLGQPLEFAPIADPYSIAQSIRQACLDGIQERIPDFDLKVYETDKNVGIIVVYIPSSEQRPHMVSKEHRTDFFRRYGTDKRPMSVGEIRDAFLSNTFYRRMIELELIAQGQLPRSSETLEDLPTYIQILTERSVERFFQRYLISSVQAQSIVIVSPFIGQLADTSYTLNDLIQKSQKDGARIYVITQEPHEEYHQIALSVLEKSPTVEIRYNPNVHAKLYVCWSREEEESFALFGSANLTSGGYRYNIELGMMILSKGFGRNLVRNLYQWASNELRTDTNSKRVKAIN